MGFHVNVRYFDNYISVRYFRKPTTLILAFFWAFGLATGYLLFDASSGFLSSLMAGCVYAPVSIVTLVSAYIFPFLCSALAVFLSSPWLLPVICFGKAVLLSFVFTGVSFAWESSAVLIRWMILFCDSLCTPFLYCWCQRYISGERKALLWDYVFFALPFAAIPAAVYVWIIPFGADILIL
jgi:hypothetical protein